MPQSADRSRVRSVCAGRPIARFEPWPRISSVLPAPSAHCTAFSTSLGSRALRLSVIWAPAPPSLVILALSHFRTESRIPPFLKMLRSKPGEIGKRQLAGPHMHAAELGAGVQGRKHLAGIEQAAFVERAFEALLLGEIDLGKHGRHQIALLDPDPMLACQHAAHLHAEPQDVGAESLGALELAGLIGVVQDERM